MIERVVQERSAEGSSRRPGRRTRLAILVNTIAPYRLPIYAALAETFDTLVLHGGTEANRSWQLAIPPSLKTREVWTVQIPIQKQTGVTGVWDTQYLHLNGGLLWWLPQFRPDAILTNEMGLRTGLALLYGWLARVPVWVQWEGTLHSERNVSAWKRRFRSLFAKLVPHWVSFGACSSEYLLSLGVQPRRLLEVQNTVPHQPFLEEPIAPITWLEREPRPIILSVGQLINRKGLHTLIAACGRLIARGKPCTLVLVGDGPERERLLTQARDLGVACLHLLPNQPQAVLNGLYRAADVFVFPTLEDVWGLVVSEALWAGTPVLCSKYAGSAEIVPAENVFDPLCEESFDRALEKAVGGSVMPPEPEKLRTCEQVSESLRRSLLQSSPAPSHVAEPLPAGSRYRAETLK